MRKAFNLPAEVSVPFVLRLWPFRDAEVVRRFGNGLVTAGACCEGDVEDFIDRMRAQGKMK